MALTTDEDIGTRILILRGQKVLLDSTLATMYGVTTKVLLQAVKRQADRFPPDFMFRLSESEFAGLRSQTVTSKQGSGGRRHLPYVFTEQGVAMLSSVLRSARAVAVNIEIMRAFVRLRETIAGNRELREKIDALERRVDEKLSAQDHVIVEIMNAIRALMAPPETKKRAIGFVSSS
ncbi:MAG TPA: ORF6N domain-containing protein [Rhodanobacteraceae bacterium]|nr:ORF6N domain-containing protein [Rhodanobacteraceae bacterium]